MATVRLRRGGLDGPWRLVGASLFNQRLIGSIRETVTHAMEQYEAAIGMGQGAEIRGGEAGFVGRGGCQSGDLDDGRAVDAQRRLTLNPAVH